MHKYKVLTGWVLTGWSYKYCEICYIIQSVWYDDLKNINISYFYQNEFPKSPWLPLDKELTCDEMIIKKIIE